MIELKSACSTAEKLISNVRQTREITPKFTKVEVFSLFSPMTLLWQHSISGFNAVCAPTSNESKQILPMDG